MAQSATAVQFDGAPRGVRPWLKVSGEDNDVGTPVERLQLDIAVEDSEFLFRLARYRNALARAQGTRLKKQNSRKSVGEDFIAIQCQAEREALRAMFDACGPLPDGNDRKAMDAYAKRVVAWDEKRAKKSGG